MDTHTEVTTTGWLSRIGNSIKTVLFGLLMFFGAFPLLWWNEGRAVKVAQSLDEGAGAVVAVGTDGMSGQAPKECATTSALRVDLSSSLERARCGLSAVRHPTRVERAARKELAYPGELQRRRRDFEKKSLEEQRTRS